MTRHGDTIYAPATALGSFHQPVAVCIVRLSGPGALYALSQLTGKSIDYYEWKPRYAYYETLRRPSQDPQQQTTVVLDRCLVLFFRGPQSFTGEDVVELHLHGSKQVVDSVLDAISGLKSSAEGTFVFRMAEEGEFTRRAMMNGKLDLTQVEALSDLLHCDTDKQQQLALRQLSSEAASAETGDAAKASLGVLVRRWQQELLHALAYLTAYIDFGDHSEANDAVLSNFEEMCAKVLPMVWSEVVEPMCKELGVRMVRRTLNSDDAVTSSAPFLDGSYATHYEIVSRSGSGPSDASEPTRGQLIRDGFRVVLVGEPNVGKSSLLNLLAKKDVAIVSDIAGTTRDVVEVRLNLGGYVVLVSDTAGIREIALGPDTTGHDQIESEGIRRSIERLKEAHLILHVRDIRDEQASNESETSLLTRVLREQSSRAPVLTIWNKVDLATSTSNSETDTNRFMISCKTKFGIDSLLSGVTTRVQARLRAANAGEDEAQDDGEAGLIITRKRHRECLLKCLEELCQFYYYMQVHQRGSQKEYFAGDMSDMAAEHLRQASYYLGMILGQTDLEQVLDIVFKEFCVGK